MTDVIQFASGFNNAGSLANLPHQPTTACPGILYGAPRYSLSNHRKDDYPYTYLPYPKIYPSWFQALNTFFGFDDLAGITSVDGTFHLRMNNGNWANFNGTISFVIVGSPTQRIFAAWSQVKYDIVGLVKL